MKARRKVVERRPSRRTALTLTQRLERLERHYFSQKAAPSGARFNVEGDTVTDRTTGLMWTRKNVGGKRFTWADAKAACSKERAGDHEDWRLPTIQELLTLVDYSRTNPAIDKDAFECESNWYWTATPLASSPAVCAWVVSFGNGGSSWSLQGYELCVRAVRAGQSFGRLA